MMQTTEQVITSSWTQRLDSKGNFTLAVSLTPATLPENNTCDAAMPLSLALKAPRRPGSNPYALNDYTSWCDPEGIGAESSTPSRRAPARGSRSRFKC